jgi:hypothetical protein
VETLASHQLLEDIRLVGLQILLLVLTRDLRELLNLNLGSQKTLLNQDRVSDQVMIKMEKRENIFLEGNEENIKIIMRMTGLLDQIR